MLAIGRALMSRPRLLLLDEPSLGLAPLIVKQIFEAIREINEAQKTTVLLVEQNAYHALRLAHRGYVMQTGRIALSGTARELLANPEVRAAYLEGGRRLSAASRHRADPVSRADDHPVRSRRRRDRAGAGPNWKPAWQIAPLTLLLAAADRFLHYALFAAPLGSLSGLLAAAAVLGLHHGGRVLPCPRPQDGAAIPVALRAATGRSAGAPDNRTAPAESNVAFAPGCAAC